MNTSSLLTGAALLVVGLLVGWLLGAQPRRASGSPTASGAELAGLLAPAATALERVERQLHQVERDRVGAYAGLTAQVAALHRVSAEVGTQASALAGALRAPAVRGRWGEVQLQRIVELAGLVEHCDFDLQVSAHGPDGGARPDMVVRLPGGRIIPMDAKTPLDAWLRATEAPDDGTRRRRMAEHARAVRAHVDELAARAYWRSFAPAPEFVVMFLPADALLDAALSADPGLAEHALGRNVVVATPGTLLALLRTVAFSWRQDRLSASAQEILQLGQELYDRLGTLAGHFNRVGTNLDRATEAFNSAVGSLEGRVLVSARRFADLGVAGNEPESMAPVVRASRRVMSGAASPVSRPEAPKEAATVDG